MSKFLKLEVDLDNFIDNLNNLIEKNNRKIDELLKLENKTFKNFVKPLEDLDVELGVLFTPLSHLNSVLNSDKTQDIYAKALPIITKYSTQLSQNLDIYNANKEILKNDTSLNDEQKRVLELNILDFELSGAHLDKKTKKRLEEINIKKSELSNNFSQNLLDATNEYEYITENEDDVLNLPKSDIESAKFEEDGVTKYRFTLQMPSYIAYMTYGTNRTIREELYRAYTSRAPQNAKIIDELLELRDEMSKLLGFSNYASYSLASKMAKDEETVLNFLEKLLNNSTQQAKNELDELQNIADVKLQSYDTAFYSEILKKAKYDIDEDEYRPYFEQQSVVNGLFEFLNKLFNIEFKKVSLDLYHEKVLSYDLYVKNNLTARLYLDLEARKSKRGGAWMHDFESNYIDADGNKHLASAFVVCNFAESTDQNPSLLRHDDVVTLFHEMGHAIHHLLSDVGEYSISGVNGVEWDAVEYPSQFLENFAYEKDVLKLFAKHYKTGEILPDEMIDKLIKAKNFMSASSMLRQLEFSLFDFKLHQKVYKADEVQELLDSIREKTALIKPPKYNKFQNGFAHIFAGGYAAGYYSYKWAEVLSADTFFSIVDEGIFNSKTAKEYLNIVLKSGGSKSMRELFIKLHHKEPDPNSLLRLNGILKNL